MWKRLWSRALTGSFVLTESLFSSVGFPPTSHSSLWTGERARREQPNKLPSRLNTRLSLIPPRKWHFPSGTVQVWLGLQTQIAVSPLAAAAARSPAPLLPGSLEQWELRAVIAGRDQSPRWSSFWLTHQELCYYKPPNVTGNGQQMSYDVLHQNTHSNSVFPPQTKYIIQLHLYLTFKQLESRHKIKMYKSTNEGSCLYLSGIQFQIYVLETVLTHCHEIRCTSYRKSTVSSLLFLRYQPKNLPFFHIASPPPVEHLCFPSHSYFKQAKTIQEEHMRNLTCNILR